MSDNPNGPSGSPDSTGGVDTGTNTNTNPVPSGNDDKNKKVAYDTYAKTLAQEKNLRERLAQAEEKIKAEEMKRLEAEGKKDEMIEHLKKSNAELVENQTRIKAEKTHQTISSQVQKKAMELGCVDIDLASNLIDFSKLDVDELSNVGVDSLSIAMDRLKRDKPYLFQSKKPSVIDGAPVTGTPTPVPTSVEEMTSEQMEQMYRNKFS